MRNNLSLFGSTCHAAYNPAIGHMSAAERAAGRYLRDGSDGGHGSGTGGGSGGSGGGGSGGGIPLFPLPPPLETPTAAPGSPKGRSVKKAARLSPESKSNTP